MITVKLDPSWIAEAKALANNIWRTGLASTPNYTGLDAPERFEHGYIGEFALVRGVLLPNGVRCTHRILANGKRQRTEITAWMFGRGVDIECKAGSKPYYRFLMNPIAQDDEIKECDFLAGMRLDMGGGIACFMGGVTLQDFLKCSTVVQRKVPTREMPYDALPISSPEFIAMLDAE